MRCGDNKPYTRQGICPACEPYRGIYLATAKGLPTDSDINNQWQTYAAYETQSVMPAKSKSGLLGYMVIIIIIVLAAISRL